MHIGGRIRTVLAEKGMAVMDFAAALSCNRQNVYKIFEKPHISTDLLFRISIILEHDFFADISTELSSEHHFQK